MSGIAIKHPNLQDVVRVYFKGAPEEIVSHCGYWFDAEGGVETINKKYVLEDTMESRMCKDGHRVIAFSYADLETDTFESIRESTGDFTAEDSLMKLRS